MNNAYKYTNNLVEVEVDFVNDDKPSITITGNAGSGVKVRIRNGSVRRTGRSQLRRGRQPPLTTLAPQNRGGRFDWVWRTLDWAGRGFTAFNLLSLAAWAVHLYWPQLLALLMLL